MKKFITILLLVYASNLFSQKIENHKIFSKRLEEEREIIVYTPENYDMNSTAKYGVAYVFDAQQREMFDAVHSTIAFHNYGLAPMIVVGVISTNRNKDFLPQSKNQETISNLRGNLGNADKLQKFLTDELFSFIDRSYNTLPTKIGIAHSNGATFLNYGLLTAPPIFNAYFSIDANLNFDRRVLIEKLSAAGTDLLKRPDNQPIFYYTCNAKNTNDWTTTHALYYEQFKKTISDTSIQFKQRFFEDETHVSVFQAGVIDAFKEYYRYQYFDTDNLISYYKYLDKNKYQKMNAVYINNTARIFYNFGMTDHARKILNAFAFTGENDLDSSNLYGMFDNGKMYASLGLKARAKEYFTFCKKTLNDNKSKIPKEEYEFGMGKVNEELAKLK